MRTAIYRISVGEIVNKGRTQSEEGDNVREHGAIGSGGGDHPKVRGSDRKEVKSDEGEYLEIGILRPRDIKTKTS